MSCVSDSGCGLCAFVAAGVGDVCHGRGHEDGGECADDYTEEHREGERANSVAAEDEDAEEHEDGR